MSRQYEVRVDELRKQMAELQMSIHAAFAAVVERLEMLENHTGINNAVVEGDDMVAARNGKIKKAHR